MTSKGKVAAILILLLCCMQAMAQRQDFFCAAWWNVENLFDTRHDTLRNDLEFTPDGDRHWTLRRLKAKCDGIYKTLTMMDMPDVVGLAEVENDDALQELCQGTPLASMRYAYVHYESTDPRGIDCALIYRKDRFTVLQSVAMPLDDTATGFHTRDMLYVKGLTSGGDTVCLLLNHWPSRRGGIAAAQRRMDIAATLRHTMDSLRLTHPTALILAMGDFNATSDEPPFTSIMGFGDECRNDEGIENLACRLHKDIGTYRFQGQWQYLDNMLLMATEGWSVEGMEAKDYDHLMVDERRYPGRRPRHTYLGVHYEGGVSDHLPLLLTLRTPAH